MPTKDSLKKQLRRHSVALISLVVAVTSLAYNTWRNERTEYNRNQRVLSVEILQKLENLQELVYYNHYDRDTVTRGNPRSGWAIVLTIRELSQILEPPLPAAAESLYQTWDANWSGLGKNRTSAEAILESIDDVRGDTRGLLHSLE